MKRFMKKIITSLVMIAILGGLVLEAVPARRVDASGTTLKLTVKHPDMNTVKLSWTKLDNAYGYRIYYKASESATYELVSETLDNKIVFDGLKSDSFYYFRIDAYSIIGGKNVVVGTTGEQRVRSNKIGIDVSKWNNDKGVIDWNKVKASGIEYVIVRVSYGTLPKYEKMYKDNIEGAQKAGLPVGVYIYSIATTTEEAKKEADFVINILKGFKLQYPVAFDIEDKRQEDEKHISARRKLNTDLTKAFCEKVKAAGYKPMIYTGCSFSRTYLDKSQLTEYDLWIAHYESLTKYIPYTDAYHFGRSCNAPKTRMWQYSSVGKVDGIKGNVDMNYELDLKESVYGMAHYNVSKGTETYVAASGETLESISDKYNMTVGQLIKYDKNYTESSSIKKGSTILIDSIYMENSGKKVAKVSGVKVTSAAYNALSITWSPLNYSDGYYVYRSEQKDGTYTKIASVTGTSYKNSNLKHKKQYYYKVYGYKKNGSNQLISSSATVVGGTPVQETPSKVRVTATTHDSVSLAWNKSSNATTYRVYMATSKNGEYKRVATTKSTTYTHKNLKTNQTYYYKVAAIRTVDSKNYWSAHSGIVQAKPQLKQVALKSITAGSKRATLKWNTVKGAKGYMVYRSNSKNGTYKKVATVSATTYTNKSLTKNKRYYYKVRAYRVVNGKNVYGSYSSIMNVKAK